MERRLWVGALAALALVLLGQTSLWPDTKVLLTTENMTLRAALNLVLGTGVPGLTLDGICDDDCRKYVTRRTWFEGGPSRPEYWFTCNSGGTGPKYLPDGNDSGPCTETEPCIDLDLAEALCNNGNNIRLDHCLWDAALGGELVTWDGWTTLSGTGGTGQMIDDPVCLVNPARPELLTWDDRPTIDLSGNSVLNGDNGTNLIRTTGNGGRYLGWAGTWFRHFPQNPNTSVIMIAMDNLAVPGGGEQSHFVSLNNRWSDVVGSNAFVVRNLRNDSSAITIAGAGLGGGSLRDPADFDFGCTGDSCATNDPVPQALCGSGCTDLFDTGGPPQTSGSPDGLCDDDGLNYGEPYDCCNVNGQCRGRGLHFVNGGRDHLVVSDATFELLHTQYNDSGAGPGCGVTSTFDKDIVSNFQAYGAGSPLICKYTQDAISIPGAPSIVSSWSGNPTQSALFRVAQALTIGPHIDAVESGAWRMASNTPTSTYASTLEVYQSTATKVHQAFEVAGQFSGDSLTLVERCNVAEGLHQVSGDALVLRGDSTTVGTVTIDTDADTVYDCDDGGSNPDCFRFHTTRHANVAAVDMSDPQGGGQPWVITGNQLFGGTEGGSAPSNESGGDGTDGNVFDDGTTDLSALAACGDGEECDAVCPDAPWTWDLPPNAFIPSAVTKARIKIVKAKVGTRNKGIGARPGPAGLE